MKKLTPEIENILKASGPAAILDIELVVKKCNPQFVALLGLPNTAILNNPLSGIISVDFDENLLKTRPFPLNFISTIKILSSNNKIIQKSVLIFKKLSEAEEIILMEIIPLQEPPSQESGFVKNLELSVLENIPSMYFWETVNIGQDTQLKITESVKKITGYSAKEIISMRGKILNIVHEEDAADVIRELNSLNLSARQLSSQMRYRITRKDGEVRWLHESISVVPLPDKSGNKMTGAVTDITELKKFENEFLDERSKLIEASNSKDRFINILSHDLRAPFTSILGFSEILLNETQLNEKEKIEYLTYIYDASQNQLQFINYLLDWSRLRTGSLKLEPQRLKVLMIMYNCISALTGNAIRKNIDIQMDISENLYIQADERLISQVIMNLLNNSIKFSQENSTIEISAAPFNSTQMEITIKDHGIGISMEDQQKIFSVEKTYSREGTKGEKGSGFGLALVKEIVEKHNGEIWFYSEEGKGTEFHFTVPLPCNNILLVHDDIDELNQLQDIISGAFPEFMIFTAENGFEAIGINIDKSPNLIIAKNDLPLMNGLQLIESMKKSDNELKTPFIIIMDEDDTEESKKYITAGVMNVLKGLNDRAAIISAISSALS